MRRTEIHRGCAGCLGRLRSDSARIPRAAPVINAARGGKQRAPFFSGCRTTQEEGVLSRPWQFTRVGLADSARFIFA
jgi:hypothetical protein